MKTEKSNHWWKRNLALQYTHKDFLYNEYYVNKKPCTQIAKEQNTTYTTIIRWLNVHNIPRHPHYEYYRVNLLGKNLGS